MCVFLYVGKYEKKLLINYTFLALFMPGCAESVRKFLMRRHISNIL